MKPIRKALGAVVMAVVMIAAAPDPLPSSAGTNNRVINQAMHWFTDMLTGKLDRATLAPVYSAQLTDADVAQLSQQLNRYGAPPKSAEIMQSRVTDKQTLYLIKFLFPRGDAAAMLFGFDASQRISGISIVSMAGD